MKNINFKTTKILAQELNNLIKDGYFKDKNEALNDALKLLIKRHKLNLIEKKILNIRKKFRRSRINLTETIVKLHEEENDNLS